MTKKLLINGILIYIGAGIFASLIGNALELIPYIVVSINIFAPILGCIALRLNAKNKVFKKPKINFSKIKFDINITIVLIVVIGLYLSEVDFVQVACDSLELGAISLIFMSFVWSILSKFIKIPSFTECWRAFI